MTCVLLGLWLLLMAFAAVSALEPPWLRAISHLGERTEAGAYKHSADACLQRMAYAQAIIDYRKALEITPNDTGALVNLAVAYAKSGNSQRAAQLYDQVLKMDTRRGLREFVEFSLGELVERERPLEAIEHFKHAIGYSVEQDLVYRKLAMTCVKVGRLEDARAAFERVLETRWDPALHYRYMLCRVRDTYHDDPDRVAEIEAQLASDPSVMELDRYDLETIRRLRQNDREIAKTHHHLGLICERLGEADAAISHYEQALQIWPGCQASRGRLRLVGTQRDDSRSRIPRGKD